MKRLVIAAAASLMVLSGCASIEPKACSAEWFDYKSEKVLRKFAVQNRGLIGDLRQLAKADGKIDPLKALTLVTKAKDFDQLAKSFETVVMPELNNAMKTCGTNAEFIPAFKDFLRDEGVSEEALKWVEPFMSLMQTMRALEPTPATPAPVTK